MPAQMQTRVVDIVQHFHPIHNFTAHLRGREIWYRVVSPDFPVEKVLLELLIGKLGPILYERFFLLLRGKSRLGPLALNLGNTYFLVGGVHEEIEGIERPQLEGELLMLLDGIMIEFFRALADLSAA